jgi:hypothetical protein
MRRLIHGLIPTVVAGTMLCCLPSRSFAQETEVARPYQLSFTSKITISYGPDEFKVHERTGTVLHTLQLRPQQSTLVLDRVQQKYVLGGVFQFDTTMNREKIVRRQSTKTEMTQVSDLPDEKRKGIERSLGVPLCTTHYDASGKELKRVIHDDHITKMTAVMSEMNITMFFHPPFLAGQDEWDFVTEFDTIDPGIARGTMTYKKVATDGDLVTVKGSGVFRCERYPLSEALTETDLKYVVASEHVYDVSRHAWVSATATVEVSYGLEKGGTVGAMASGTMNWKLESLPRK